MNKDNAKEFLPLVQALAEGKTIQYKHEGYDKEWRDYRNPSFHHPASYYRIKPEPRSIYIVEVLHGINWQQCSIWFSRDVAYRAFASARDSKHYSDVRMTEFLEKLD